VTSEMSTSFEDAWNRFQEVTSVQVGLGIEDEWAQGRAQFLVFLVSVLDRRVRGAIAAFIERLRGLSCLDLYPEDYWHMTVKMVGFEVDRRTRDDEVLGHEVQPILRAAEDSLAGESPFNVQLVFLEAHDGGRLKTLHQKLARALSHYPRFPYDGEPYLPHVSLARYVSQESLAELKERLASLRSEKLAPLAVGQVEFVRARPSGDYPKFDIIGQITLGRQA
jgi:2'-5' RNA ligase